VGRSIAHRLHNSAQIIYIDLCVKVVFEGVRGKSYQGDVALDDIVIKDGFCSPLKECEFEDVNMCGWSNEKRYFTQYL